MVKEPGNGPFPGDNAVFAFGLYWTTDLKETVETGSFTLMNFNEHAFCDVSYQLDGGVLLGAGAFDFNAGSFAVVVTGGTGKYAGASGEIRRRRPGRARRSSPSSSAELSSSMRRDGRPQRIAIPPHVFWGRSSTRWSAKRLKELFDEGATAVFDPRQAIRKFA